MREYFRVLKLWIRDQVVILALGFGEKRVLLWESFFARIADPAAENFVELPVKLPAPTFPAFSKGLFLLGAPVEGGEMWCMCTKFLFLKFLAEEMLRPFL